MDQLDATEIRARVPNAVDRIDALADVDSTNDYLKTRPLPAANHWHLAVADTQTAGRGRGDNAWLSPPGGGLWMSTVHTFSEVPARLSSFTLVAGVAVVDALGAFGLRSVQLKWPNDLVVDGCKLGGVLVEALNNGRSAVCGIGINIAVPNVDELKFKKALRPTDLTSVLDEVPDRNRLAGAIVSRLIGAADRFSREGFAPFADAWSQYDWLRGREVYVSGIKPSVMGVANGIGENGELILRDNETDFRVVAGSVRLVDSKAAR